MRYKELYFGCDTINDETLKFVQKSKYRQKVLKALDGNVLMPTEIAVKVVLKLIM